MKKILIILLIYLPLIGFGQTTNKLIVDSIRAKHDSIHLKSPVALKQPLVSTKEIKAPLYKQDNDTLGTKA